MNSTALNAYAAQLLNDAEDAEPRRKTEVLLDKRERSYLDQLRGGLGRSPYFRNLLHEAARTHGIAPAAAQESRRCRGPGKPASRGGAPMGMRRQV